MRIIFYGNHNKSAPWIAALQAALPGAEIEAWHPGAAPADHAVLWGPPQQLFDEQPRLRGVFNMGAGVDAFLHLKLPPQAVLVRLEDAGMATQMAEYVCQAVIRHFRDIDFYEREMEQGRWSFRKPLARSDFPVGVMGLGVLGSRVAQAVAHFDFPVAGWSRSRHEIEGVRCHWGADQLDEFLAATRILVCLLPLTPQTENILSRATLSKLRPGGYLVNVARGAHVVDEDLVALLDEGHLAGATLDVFRTEPLPQGHPFWNHPKIVMTPHASARTLREETVAQIARKIVAFERGEAIGGIVDTGRGY
ncbi:2-hydroxyacid dehydrogenase [Ramlibacter sp.]|uniref:2-hydroxyacid dehydrogenase n=1 Tax=Ramlibacter sp. TaxID=1917967 RepID=UPI003D0D2733